MKKSILFILLLGTITLAVCLISFFNLDAPAPALAPEVRITHTKDLIVEPSTAHVDPPLKPLPSTPLPSTPLPSTPLPSTPLPSTPLPSTPLPQDPFTNVDQILKTLEVGKIAFNSPKTIALGNTATIQLLLGLAESPDKLSLMITSTGVKEDAVIRVSDRMEARLAGPNFTINPVTPEQQAVTRTDVTEWKWEIKPINEGRQHLHLTLSALIKVDGVATLRKIRTFDKEISVEVTWNQQVISFFNENLSWLSATVLLPLGGWFWRKRTDKGTKSNDTANSRTQIDISHLTQIAALLAEAKGSVVPDPSVPKAQITSTANLDVPSTPTKS